MKKLTFFLAGIALSAAAAQADVVVSMSKDYGIRPDKTENVSQKVANALADIKARYGEEYVTITFDPGRYNFHPKGSSVREYFISNHDQDNPKNVGIAIENWDNLTIDAPGADFIFHGRMLPLAVIGSANCTLKGFSIDFATPHITQVEILGNDADGITFRVAPWSNPTVERDGKFSVKGEGWTLSPRAGIAFDGQTRHLVYRTSDIYTPLDSVIPVKGDNHLFRAPKWTDSRLTPGTVVALRGWGRPTPGIFLSEDRNTSIADVKVHYAEGMGLLAQLCDSISLTGFGVCLRGDDDPRYFTTQADATHFSGCRGLISSVGGLYEGMMDDAINVHGTYLKVQKMVDSNTLQARYMHSQSYGFKWGEVGDTVQIILAETMETIPQKYIIESIRPVDKPSEAGAKDFDIRFTTPLPDTIAHGGNFGLENLQWTPEVLFADNIIRNNRARGSLFSTPRRTIVERNTFDHTSGTAILLCGDCMGWFETGACHNVTIRNNRFINSLTNMFQFTEAVISIYPEIHNLADQQQYFHSGIVIEDNVFDTFDRPILYAKSTDGLTFRRNTVTLNTDFKPFHSNTFNFRFQHCRNVVITDDNTLPPSPSIIFE